MPYSHLKGAVISSDAVAAHEQNMVAMSVDVRDGDDRIEVANTPEEEAERVTVNINTETGEASGEEGEGGEGDPSGEGAQGEVSDVDFSNSDLTTIDAIASLVSEAEEGKDQLMAEAVEKGLDAALVAVLEDEITTDGKPSKTSYEALAAVGYTKAFVDAFIAGQEANAQKYISAIHGFVGGADNFNKLTGFLGANHSSLADAFNAAVDRNDVSTMKAILETGKGLYTKSFGKAPARSVTTAAKPTAVAPAPKVEGFASRDEMVKAMSDVRYQKDAKFRREVELRVFASNF